MGLLLATAITVAILLAVERVLRLGSKGRGVLIAVVVAWALWDAIQTVRMNQEHRGVLFLVSLADSAVALVLWLWISSWLREAESRRGAGQGCGPP